MPTSFLIICLLAYTTTYAQTISGAMESLRQLNVKTISSSIKVDGNLDEPEWQDAAIAKDFTQAEPNEGLPSRYKTTVRILSNDKQLYIGVTCFDTVGRSKYKAPGLDRDFEWTSFDMFAVCIDGFLDKRNSVTFATNAYGAQKDYLSFDDMFYDSDWNGLWIVRTNRTDSAWTAEFAIPWKTLRYSGKTFSHTWGINFLRLQRSSNEISSWSPYPRAFGFNRMKYAGTLNNITPPKKSTNIQINPYLLLNSQQSNGLYTSNQLKPGGEIKWAINQNSVLDGTVNTDFAQSDADVQVNNLSRFSVLFPEKRQFFLENASLFGIGLQPDDLDNSGGDLVIRPFFTRTIGLDDQGNPIPIDFGARFINRSVKSSFGGMVIQQKGTATSPSTQFFVSRYNQNLGEQNRIGVMLTAKNQSPIDSKGKYANIAGAVDGLFRLSASQSLDFMFVPSANNDNTGKGVAGYLRYLKTTDKLKIWLTEALVSKNFMAASGFVSRQDVINTNAGVYLFIRSKKLPSGIRSFEPGIASAFFHQSSTGRLTERDITAVPVAFNFQNGGMFQLSVNHSYQLLASSFNPPGIEIAPGSYSYFRYSLTMGNNPSKKISFKVKYESGGFFNGKLNTANVQLNIVPLPQIGFHVNYTDNNFHDVGITHFTGHIPLWTVETRLALNARVQLTGLYQYNAQNNFSSYNIRFSWEYKPLSFIYLIWNNRAFDQTGTGIKSKETDNTILAKVSFLKQF